MKQLSVFAGVVRYEFLMQIRRRALWITLFLLSALLTIQIFNVFQGYQRFMGLNVLANLVNLPLLYVMGEWTSIVNRLLPLGVGVMLADRLVRDRRTRAEELFVTTPAALSARLFGKFLGSLLATLIPFFLYYMLGVGVIVYYTGNWLAVPWGLITFAVATLPGLIFVSAFSLAFPTIMWVPLYQFCFIGYWFWGNLLGTRPGIPTISETILTPDGKYITDGFFTQEGFLHATPLLAIESIVLLIAVAALVLLVLWRGMRWQQQRQ